MSAEQYLDVPLNRLHLDPQNPPIAARPRLVIMFGI